MHEHANQQSQPVRVNAVYINQASKFWNTNLCNCLLFTLKYLFIGLSLMVTNIHISNLKSSKGQNYACYDRNHKIGCRIIQMRGGDIGIATVAEKSKTR